MSNDPSSTACLVFNIDDLHVERQVERTVERHRGLEFDQQEVVGPWSYRAKLGQGTIVLSPVAFRILRLLASRPYHAFSRRRIVEAINTENHPVTLETLSHHIHELRGQLGFYRDYVQTVPYIGYRFKA